VGLEELLKIFFGEILFTALFMSIVRFTAVVNGRDSSVGDVMMFSSIAGSESTDLKNLYPKYQT
jgi:hypothetical protein